MLLSVIAKEVRCDGRFRNGSIYPTPGLTPQRAYPVGFAPFYPFLPLGEWRKKAAKRKLSGCCRIQEKIADLHLHMTLSPLHCMLPPSQ
eukprot:scaffold18263_cov85-Skeletonema_dohrnii-CCMP3373.AAC.3